MTTTIRRSLPLPQNPRGRGPRPGGRPAWRHCGIHAATAQPRRSIGG
jgi:hypothetical protein